MKTLPCTNLLCENNGLKYHKLFVLCRVIFSNVIINKGFMEKEKLFKSFWFSAFCWKTKEFLLKLSGDIHNIIKGHFIAILSES